MFSPKGIVRKLGEILDKILTVPAFLDGDNIETGIKNNKLTRRKEFPSL
jgi:hypothetical protein